MKASFSTARVPYIFAPLFLSERKSPRYYLVGGTVFGGLVFTAFTTSKIGSSMQDIPKTTSTLKYRPVNKEPRIKTLVTAFNAAKNETHGSIQLTRDQQSTPA